MADIQALVFGGIIAVLVGIIIMQSVFHRSDTRELRDRFMAKDYHDYSVGKVLQKAQPKVADDVAEVEELYGITDRDKQEVDRLPVN